MKTMTKALLLLLMALTMPMVVNAKNIKTPKVYIFGFSASFQDSTIYMTDVQEITNVWIESKTKFLLGREHYSRQLNEYLTAQQHPNRVCLVIFALKREDAEKKYLKMRKQYTSKSKRKYDMKYLNTNDFKFSTVNLDIEEEPKK